jgi:hypothetical protein
LDVNDVDPGTMRYMELVRDMEKEFGPRDCAEDYFQELTRSDQRPGEDLSVFGQEANRLTALAYPNSDREKRDRAAKLYFTQGIADAEIRKEVFKTRT